MSSRRWNELKIISFSEKRHGIIPIQHVFLGVPDPVAAVRIGLTESLVIGGRQMPRVDAAQPRVIFDPFLDQTSITVHVVKEIAFARIVHRKVGSHHELKDHDVFSAQVVG